MPKFLTILLLLTLIMFGDIYIKFTLFKVIFALLV